MRFCVVFHPPVHHVHPAHFAKTLPEEFGRIIREHPLGMLVTQGSAGLDADTLQALEYEEMTRAMRRAG